eukprot:CAMPEP_0116144338 /NCGR_PEP_ID=MMETSP0329-20121206/15954_1 /TAXON_ID=697910 /ORGANISM="Pseudo-nitzschia arenysensis, Strain B593" /LENGTH=69 /DNA_ID=CAMNT_0003639765 /DNA_START=307 /DNA_END=516 /DNA_ORIENTATION=+
MAMFLMAGLVASSAGFAMYTRQADSLLRRMNSASRIQGIQKGRNLQSKSKFVSKPHQKAKTFHEKDDFF